MRTTLQTILLLVVLLLTVGTPLFQPGYQSGSVTIPLDTTTYGGIFLQARVNNSQPIWFYLDSGSSSPFIIGATRATALGLKLQGSESRAGGAGPNTYEASQTSGLTIALAQKVFT